MTTKDKLIEKLKEYIKWLKTRPPKESIASATYEMVITSLESELAKEQEIEEHETCDGCAMFQDCGCMLDVSRVWLCFE